MIGESLQPYFGMATHDKVYYFVYECDRDYIDMKYIHNLIMLKICLKERLCPLPNYLIKSK